MMRFLRSQLSIYSTFYPLLWALVALSPLAFADPTPEEKADFVRALYQFYKQNPSQENRLADWSLLALKDPDALPALIQEIRNSSLSSEEKLSALSSSDWKNIPLKSWLEAKRIDGENEGHLQRVEWLALRMHITDRYLSAVFVSSIFPEVCCTPSGKVSCGAGFSYDMIGSHPRCNLITAYGPGRGLGCLGPNLFCEGGIAVAIPKHYAVAPIQGVGVTQAALPFPLGLSSVQSIEVDGPVHRHFHGYGCGPNLNQVVVTKSKFQVCSFPPLPGNGPEQFFNLGETFFSPEFDLRCEFNLEGAPAAVLEMTREVKAPLLNPSEKIEEGKENINF